MARRFEDKPVIGFVATLLHDYVPLIDEYYYCALISRSLPSPSADTILGLPRRHGLIPPSRPVPCTRSPAL